MTNLTTPAAAEPTTAAEPTAAAASDVTASGARHRARFHPLTVASVERLTEDAVAVTLEVPEDIVEEFLFEPGQHLTLRATIGGEDVRQSYSICQSRRADPTGRRLRVAAARVPEGRMSSWLNDVVTAGVVVDVMTPQGS